MSTVAGSGEKWGQLDKQHLWLTTATYADVWMSFSFQSWSVSLVFWYLEKTTGLHSSAFTPALFLRRCSKWLDTFIRPLPVNQVHTLQLVKINQGSSNRLFLLWHSFLIFLPRSNDMWASLLLKVSVLMFKMCSLICFMSMFFSFPKYGVIVALCKWTLMLTIHCHWAVQGQTNYSCSEGLWSPTPSIPSVD